MSSALSQDEILFSSPLSLSQSIIWPQWWATALVSAVIQRLAYVDPSLGALGRTKVNDKLFLSAPPPLSLSVSLSSAPQSEVFNLPCSPGQGFGICQSPQACLGPQASEWNPERWKREELWDSAQRKQKKSKGICIGISFSIPFFCLTFFCSVMWNEEAVRLSYSLPTSTALIQTVRMKSQGWQRQIPMLHFPLSTLSASSTIFWHS